VSRDPTIAVALVRGVINLGRGSHSKDRLVELVLNIATSSFAIGIVGLIGRGETGAVYARKIRHG